MTDDQRRQLAKLLQDEEALLDFVRHATVKGAWRTDPHATFFLEALEADSEEEFFASLCNIGFVTFTEYLSDNRQAFVASSTSNTSLH